MLINANTHQCCIGRLLAAVPKRLQITFLAILAPLLLPTNQLETKVTVKSGVENMYEIIARMYNSSLLCSCWYWGIDDYIGQSIWSKIRNQAEEKQRIGRFCFLGSRIGSFIGSGSNCIDWIYDILKDIENAVIGRIPVSLENMLEIIRNPISSIPTIH